MASDFERLIDTLAEAPDGAGLGHLRRGIEKESLRVAPDGRLAQTPHPAGLGSPLTHPHITTDFSESQLELITQVFDDADACLAQLEAVHAYVYRHLGDELMWSASMPCMLSEGDRIPLGRYGSSNVGTAKTVYRRGLGHRYGRLMQTISGVHYNFSLPEVFWPVYAELKGWDGDLQTLISRSYFDLIRNFRRQSWLLFYLFGASPAVCGSFLRGRIHELERFDEGSLYQQWATSLRMGGLGYQSDAQSTLQVSYNGLREYAHALHDALTRSWPPYEEVGLKVDGVYQQLSTNLLQIENEFYGTIRPKRTIKPGERALHALGERGVEYVEVRCMDVDPFAPLGIDVETIRFLDVFLVACLLADSPPDTPTEIDALQRNRTRAVSEGRRPGLELEDGERLRTVPDWGSEIIDRCRQVAPLLDRAKGGDAHARAVETQAARVADPALTPSARILAAMAERGVPFFRFAMDAATEHAAGLRACDPGAEVLGELARQSEDSVREQARIEAADQVDFDTYLQQYMSQDLLPPTAR